ncbi:DUF4198 domain-containing protein [Paenibacillus sp. TRM 82003]|nr:DUF4198 domain-containing protein [Paenibacillus sp. TRM 82003]
MTSKKVLSLLLASAASLSMALTASAHDGWSQVASPIVASGETSYVELLLGNHSNEHKSYRIDGNWNPDTTKAYVVTPTGKKADISGTMFYTGEVSDTDNPRLNNGYVASFSASSPGAYIVSVEGDSIFAHGGVASRTLRSAKSFAAIADVPLLQRVKDLRGFGQAVATDRAEWVPLFNPAATVPGQEVSAQLMMKGEPLAGIEAALIRRSTSDAETFVTDENGVVTFVTRSADSYLLRAKPATEEKVEGKYDSTNYEATMTFAVQNGKTTVAGSPASALPLVYVDGVEVSAKGLAFANGALAVDAEWLRSDVDADVAGADAVSLRAAVEAAGGIVEYFPAVGAVRSVVYVYTK